MSANHLAAQESDQVPTAVVRVPHHFATPAEFIFDAWLQPSRLAMWMFGPTVRDEEIVDLKVDPRVGGSFSFVVRRQGEQIDHVGTYREIDRPRRLEFTWGIAGESADESVVAIEIQPAPTGCELQLTHTMDPKWAEYVPSVQGSWTKMLDKLAELSVG